MKTYLLPFLALLIFSNCNGQTPAKYEAEASGPMRIEVLDFHNEHRCATCLEIERLTLKILNEDYGDAVKKGLISFRLINADEKANGEIVEKYTAYGTTLIVSSVKNGKEEFVDLTTFAFMNFNKEEKFTAGFKKELDAALQRIRS